MKKKNIFIILVIIVVLGCIFYMNYPFFPSYNMDFGIDDYHSQIDYDNDGIDDQWDILLGARDYLDTKPKYKSVYYASGYPDDKYGVCSDVVGNALLHAGYDLMYLVNQDIQQNQEMYSIDTVDINIDFRRVVNLDIYFKNTAITLTNDIYEIDQWQGGDIVVFEGHIGIVSDIRNKDGIPYILHHASPFQLFYEEDLLESSIDEIIGHYRIS